MTNNCQNSKSGRKNQSWAKEKRKTHDNNPQKAIENYLRYLIKKAA